MRFDELPSEIQWAWAAGFIDGEGCFSPRRRRWPYADGSRPYTTFVLVVAQVDSQPLKRLERLIGGHVRGPYDRSPNQSVYFWTIAKSHIKPQMKKLWPYLGNKKKKQYLRCIALIKQG